MRRLPIRGIALALALVLMPICMILMYFFVDQVLLATRASMQERGRSQASHMAESGLLLAYDAFQSNNFALTTDANPARYVSGAQVYPPNMTFSADTDPGSPTYKWIKWTWSPDKPVGEPFSDGTESESISYRISYSDPAMTHWQIDCSAATGGFHQTQSLQGYIQSNAHYAIFSAGDLDDLSRVDDINVQGTVHANGYIYLFPKFLSSTTPPVKATGQFKILGVIPTEITRSWKPVTWPVYVSKIGNPDSFDASSPPSIGVQITGNVEAGQKIIRSGDRHGEDNSSRQIFTSTSTVTINGHALMGGANGVAMDSNNTGWAPFLKTNNLVGNVTDGSLGGHTQDCFDLRTIAPGGYYQSTAATASGGLVLNNSVLPISPPIAGVTETTFFNNAENRSVTVFDVDAATVAKAPNNLIYSLSPIRIYNCSSLVGNLTVVSPATIYTKGNVNLDGSMAVAFVTTDRLYHLSDAWNDHDTRNVSPYPSQTECNDFGTPLNPLNFPPHAGMSATPGSLTIRADLVDGVPAINELNWIPGGAYADADSYLGVAAYVTNPPGKFVTPWQADVNCAACSDGLLEGFQQCQLAMKHPTPDPYMPFLMSGYPNRRPLEDQPNPDTWPDPAHDSGMVNAKVVVNRIGSIMHLHCASMDTSPSPNPKRWDESPFVTPYLVRSYYVPFTRNFDSSASMAPSGTVLVPQYAPNISVKTLWSLTE